MAVHAAVSAQVLPSPACRGDATAHLHLIYELIISIIALVMQSSGNENS